MAARGGELDDAASAACSAPSSVARVRCGVDDFLTVRVVREPRLAVEREVGEWEKERWRRVVWRAGEGTRDAAFFNERGSIVRCPSVSIEGSKERRKEVKQVKQESQQMHQNTPCPSCPSSPSRSLKMDDSLFESYEQDLAILTASIQSKLSPAEREAASGPSPSLAPFPPASL